MNMLKRFVELPSLETRKLDKETRSIPFVASTSSVDAHDTIIDQDWDLSRYRANPVVLFEHGTGPSLFGNAPTVAERIPVARAEDVRVEGGVLKFTAVFPPEGRDDNSDRVWVALEDGRLNAVSVGFRSSKATEEKTKQGNVIYRLSGNTLFEISIVAVPSNPDAIAERSMLSALANTTVERHVNITELLAKRYACEPDDAAALLAALDKVESRSADHAAILSALSLDLTATQADATRAVLKLTERAALAEKLEPQLTEARSVIAAHESAQATREVEWLIKRGKQYSLALDEKSRKALTAYRRSDPAGFAEDYKVALDGFRAFDDSRLFEATASSSVTSAKPTTSTESLDERAAAWAEKRSITKSQALAEVARGADRV